MRFGKIDQLGLCVRMTWSLNHTITYVDASTNTSAFQYLFDTFLPTVGWTTSAHPSASATKRSGYRTYTNLLTGNTLTNYHWAEYASSLYWIWREDSTYTSVPGDLGTSGITSYSFRVNQSPYNLLDYKFWTSSERSSASMVTRGKYVMFLDLGVTDVYAYEDTSWTGVADTGSTFFFPINYWLGDPTYANAPYGAGSNSINAYLVVSHKGTSLMQPSTDSIIKGFDYYYTGTNTTNKASGAAYRITGNDIVLHVPAGGSGNNAQIGGQNVGSVIQVGSDYYYRLSSNMNNIVPMLYMGTTEPDFS